MTIVTNVGFKTENKEIKNCCRVMQTEGNFPNIKNKTKKKKHDTILQFGYNSMRKLSTGLAFRKGIRITQRKWLHNRLYAQLSRRLTNKANRIVRILKFWTPEKLL